MLDENIDDPNTFLNYKARWMANVNVVMYVTCDIAS